MSTHVLNQAGKRLDKPALAECAMSLASTLLLGCQARGKLEGDDNEPPPAIARPAYRQTNLAETNDFATCAEPSAQSD